MRISRALAIALLSLSGCGGGGGGPADGAVPVDMRKTGDLAILSQCGHPGDPGNSLGVGKFCMTIADCQDGTMKTNICSSLGNDPKDPSSDTFFCTIYPCQLDAGASQCGENASCVCGSGMGQSGCACTPTACQGPPSDAGVTD